MTFYINIIQVDIVSFCQFPHLLVGASDIMPRRFTVKHNEPGENSRKNNFKKQSTGDKKRS